MRLAYSSTGRIGASHGRRREFNPGRRRPAAGWRADEETCVCRHRRRPAHGVVLSDVSVSDQDLHQGQEDVERDLRSENSSMNGGMSEGEDGLDSAIARSRAKSGIVDTFV